METYASVCQQSKKIRAFEIRSIALRNNTSITPFLIRGSQDSILATPEWFAAQNPKVGGYILMDVSGILFFLSKARFEKNFVLFVPPVCEHQVPGRSQIKEYYPAPQLTGQKINVYQ